MLVEHLLQPTKTWYVIADWELFCGDHGIQHDPVHQAVDTSEDGLNAARSACYRGRCTANLVECARYDVAEDMSNATDDCSFS